MDSLIASRSPFKGETKGNKPHASKGTNWAKHSNQFGIWLPTNVEPPVCVARVQRSVLGFSRDGRLNSFGARRTQSHDLFSQGNPCAASLLPNIGLSPKTSKSNGRRDTFFGPTNGCDGCPKSSLYIPMVWAICMASTVPPDRKVRSRWAPDRWWSGGVQWPRAQKPSCQRYSHSSGSAAGIRPQL